MSLSAQSTGGLEPFSFDAKSQKKFGFSPARLQGAEAQVIVELFAARLSSTAEAVPRHKRFLKHAVDGDEERSGFVN